MAGAVFGNPRRSEQNAGGSTMSTRQPVCGNRTPPSGREKYSVTSLMSATYLFRNPKVRSRLSTIFRSVRLHRTRPTKSMTVSRLVASAKAKSPCPCSKSNGLWSSASILRSSRSAIPLTTSHV